MMTAIGTDPTRVKASWTRASEVARPMANTSVTEPSSRATTVPRARDGRPAAARDRAQTGRGSANDACKPILCSEDVAQFILQNKAGHLVRPAALRFSVPLYARMGLPATVCHVCQLEGRKLWQFASGTILR
jgi:hypothetical protein